MNQRDTGSDEHCSFEREQQFQAERAAGLDVAPTSEAVIERYARTRNWRLFPKESWVRDLAPLEGRYVLDFGCGEGVISCQLARLGARVLGVDISTELVEVARRRAELDGVTDQTTFVAGDILRLEPDEPVDALLCAAVLHHVDLETVFPHLLRFVKPGGRVAVQEPVAFSPALQRLRDRVPVEKDVSPDERQLGPDDIAFIASCLSDVRLRWYRMLSRLVRLLPEASQHNHRHPVTFALALADWLALSLPPLRRFAGVVVVSGTRPSGG